MNGYLSGKNSVSGSMLLTEYASVSAETDVLSKTDITPVLQGLFGEVGGLMTTAKKLARDGDAYPGFRRAALEEFGDTLWYLSALCRRLNMPLDDVFSKSLSSESHSTVVVASDLATGTLAKLSIPIEKVELDATLFALGRATAALLNGTPLRTDVEIFARHYLDALYGAGLSLAEIARGNLIKVKSAFAKPAAEDLEDFDVKFSQEEQLPRSFKIRINQRASGRSYLRWNDVFVGDPLTDNIHDRDGYRFHDVFHFAYSAILHWSPVVRSLLKQKRKSDPTYDEEQDSGRAIVVEEGLTAWIFCRSKELKFFEGQDKVSMDILKTIGDFVAGYEVERCPLKLWEQAILDGYAVFRQIRDAEGGWVIGDRAARTIRFEPLEVAK